MLLLGKVFLKMSTYVWGGLLLIIVLCGLKSLQHAVTRDPFPGVLEVLSSGVSSRITNVSFVFAIAGVFSMICLAGAMRGFQKTFGIETLAVEGKWMLMAGVLALAEISLYLHAVYRDGGTFFFTLGGDSIGLHPPTLNRVAFIQVVEGLVNVFGLFMLSCWAVLGHWVVSMLPELTEKDRKTAASETACSIFRACVVPLSLFGVLVGYVKVVDWNTGIASPPAAKFTTFLMWAVFIALFLRAWIRCHPVVCFEMKPWFVNERS